ncbi:type III-B CRISPR module RAMP protein Cmr6 [Bacillus sp. SG20001]|uniref:type III-B CRISPR module RAMP protein Cmr6 n=1 Tax=Bacillus TaxID=1386 RepID=UPI0028807EDF|nr:type III-B CRISPR module RAMP protein Cmr6 [Bacillus sp. SG20001]WNF51652.1 type III-B CRISPR module RAMP protein Cmr6 [Bacillus sp. SG20001]
MNLSLTLNKSKWEIGGSTLSDIIKDSSKKQSFYENVISLHLEQWKKNNHLLYEKFVERYYADTNPTCLVKSISPLVIGHGGEGVLETGLLLHPIYGIPYLPGTALKGVASHYAHSVLGENFPELKQGGSDYNTLFGTNERAGIIEFHDALMMPETVGEAFKVDVMTPHHSDYNSVKLDKMNKGGSVPAPRDDDSPTPIHFLTVVNGRFQLLLKTKKNLSEDAEWLELAKTILLGALEHEGIGAKTNAGYGRLKMDDVIS